MGITKFVLKRPVTVIMTLLCLLVFGISSVFHASLEQMPEMETPMMTIMARYEEPDRGYQRAGNRTHRGCRQHPGGCKKHQFLPPATVLPGLCWSMIMELTWMRRIMS